MIKDFLAPKMSVPAPLGQMDKQIQIMVSYKLAYEKVACNATDKANFWGSKRQNVCRHNSLSKVLQCLSLPQQQQQQTN